ncbi:hypothetical protein [Tsukamurella tyrosinosolvens]|uniref:hypothetical protein n=1 Tax=Tsukamurella tyrosinosolvens TaxID=57704 RepID=UPI003462790F
MTESFWTYLMRITDNASGVSISRAAEVDAGNVSRWKTGRSNPSAESVVKIARTWGRSPVEALVASGHLRQDEVDGVVELGLDVSALSDDDLIAEVLRRMKGATDADQPDRSDPLATTEGTQDQASAREKTAAQLQAHLDALTNGGILVGDADRTALMAKLQAGINALRHQTQLARILRTNFSERLPLDDDEPAADLAEAARQPQGLPQTEDGPDRWPDGQPVYNGDDRANWKSWRRAGEPADWETYRDGRQDDVELIGGPGAARDLGTEPMGRKIRRDQDKAAETPDEPA